MKKLIFLVIVALLGFYVAWPAWSGYQIRQSLERKDAAALAGKIDFASVRTGLQPYVQKEVGTALDQYIAGLGPIAQLFAPQAKQQYLKSISDTAINTLITPQNVIRIYAQKDNMRAAAEKILMEELSKPGGILSGGGAAAGGKGGGGVADILDRLKTPGGFGEAGKALQGAGVPTGQLPQPTDVLKGVIARMRANRAAANAESAKTSKNTPGSGTGGFGLANIKQFGFHGPLAMEVGIAKDGGAPKPDVIGEMAFRGLDWKVTRLVPGN